MPATFKQVHEYLIELAKQHSAPITYGKLARHFGMMINGDADVAFWSNLLGEISKIEDARDNPMLSVLVINEEKNRPGNGFYELAEHLRKYHGVSEMDRMAFYSSELAAVYDAWVEDN